MLPAQPVRACVFDAYGTVFDLASAITRLDGGQNSETMLIAQTLRAKQLEYSWVTSLAGEYIDFWSCTERAFDFALRLHAADPARYAPLLAAFRRPDPHADARPSLTLLQNANIPALLLSNGSPAMLDDALAASGLGGDFSARISIEEAGIYKPSPAAYRLAVERLGVAASAIGFLSSNAWDVYGATRFGFRAVWVNRSGSPDEYRLRRNALEARTLVEAVQLLF